MTGGVAGGRDFIPLHFYYPLNNRGVNRQNLPLQINIDTVNTTGTLELEYTSDDGSNLIAITNFTYVNHSDFMSYTLQLHDIRLYDSNISFNWLQHCFITQGTNDVWALDSISICLQYGIHHRKIFEDNFDIENNNWFIEYGEINNTSLCSSPPCAFFNQKPENSTKATRYAQTPLLDLRVVTYIDIPLAPTQNSTTDCTLGQSPM